MALLGTRGQKIQLPGKSVGCGSLGLPGRGPGGTWLAVSMGTWQGWGWNPGARLGRLRPSPRPPGSRRGRADCQKRWGWGSLRAPLLPWECWAVPRTLPALVWTHWPLSHGHALHLSASTHRALEIAEGPVWVYPGPRCPPCSAGTVSSGYGGVGRPSAFVGCTAAKLSPGSWMRTDEDRRPLVMGEQRPAGLGAQLSFFPSAPNPNGLWGHCFQGTASGL